MHVVTNPSDFLVKFRLWGWWRQRWRERRVCQFGGRRVQVVAALRSPVRAGFSRRGHRGLKPWSGNERELVTAEEGAGEWSVTDRVSVSKEEHMDGGSTRVCVRQIVFYVNIFFTYIKAVKLWLSPPNLHLLLFFYFYLTLSCSWNTSSSPRSAGATGVNECKLNLIPSLVCLCFLSGVSLLFCAHNRRVFLTPRLQNELINVRRSIISVCLCQIHFYSSVSI